MIERCPHCYTRIRLGETLIGHEFSGRCSAHQVFSESELAKADRRRAANPHPTRTGRTITGRSRSTAAFPLPVAEVEVPVRSLHRGGERVPQGEEGGEPGVRRPPEGGAAGVEAATEGEGRVTKTVLVDYDGTLADTRQRKHLIQGTPRTGAPTRWSAPGTGRCAA